MRCLYSKAHNTLTLYMRLLRSLLLLLFSFYMIGSFHSGAYFIYNKGTSSLYHTGKSSQVEEASHITTLMNYNSGVPKR